MNSREFLFFLLVVLFFVSMSILLLELALTRIFSIVLWYDYAFMAISVAFFGLGIGSLIVHMQKDRNSWRKAGEMQQVIVNKALQYSIAYAISIPVFLIIIGHIPGDTSLIYLYYLISAIPFFFGGIIMALIFFTLPKQINKLYFADLVGAAAASLLLDPLMKELGAESVLLSTSALVLGATLICIIIMRVGFRDQNLGQLSITPDKKKQSKISISRRLMTFAVMTTVACTILLIVNTVSNDQIFGVQPGHSKGLSYQLARPSEFKDISTKWNSFSRIDVTEKIGSSQTFVTNTGTEIYKDNLNGRPRELASIMIDADAATPIFSWNSSKNDLLWLHKYMDYIPYEIVRANNTLVIGGGGGEDILTSLAGGSKMVTAVELNPLVVSGVRHFGNLTGNLYDRKDVKLVIDDGRRFISSTNATYDTIVVKLVDSWAAQLAGGYALSENYLYTVEGFQQYLRHLDKENGMLVMIRWNFELPRLMPLVQEALVKETGKDRASVGQYIVAIEDRPGLYFGRSSDNQTYYPVLVMVKSSPFTTDQLNFVKKAAQANHGEIYMLSNGYQKEPFNLLFSNNSGDYNQYISEVISSNPRIPTDDSPFYFAREQIPKQMVILLATVLGICVVLGVLLFYHARRNQLKMNRCSLFHLIFAICIGIGFMFLEITFIQKFLLLLGTPILALTVILFSVLLSSGIGAYFSGRVFKLVPEKLVLISVPILAAIIIFQFLFLQDIITSTITLSFEYRVSLTFVLLSPAGFLMGFQFPSLIRMATIQGIEGMEAVIDKEDNSRNNTTLLWGATVVSSILGTVLAAMLAMVIGFNGNLLIGIGMYIGAALSCFGTLVVRKTAKLEQSI